MATSELADTVGGYRGAVGIGFVVGSRERVDQVEIVALHADRRSAAFDSGRATICAYRDSSKAGSAKEIEQVFTGSVEMPAIDRHHGTRIDASGKECAERDLGDHAQADRLFETRSQLGDRRPRRAIRLIEREAHVPVARFGTRGTPRRMHSVCAGGSFRPRRKSCAVPAT